jgi:hypothetical protein
MKRNNKNKCETITNNKIPDLKNRLRRFEARSDQKNRLRRFEIETVVIFLLLSCTNDVKNYSEYSL